ncbi:hypothetical protein PRK78_001301 [Emydomyces testavorans]|uniref:Nuclear RNA binding protein n=1 Tax=Emydomyces testavorans TaxID=2070801 RepID=A0AAF0DCQ2_9EURO|nr:hypothetical protein PRK78_001301 [Emydomyces testavorans]
MARERRSEIDDPLDDTAWDNICAARQLKASLRLSIGEEGGLPRSSSKRKLSAGNDENQDVIYSPSRISHEGSNFGDTDYNPVPSEATPPKRFRSNDWPLSTNVSVLIENQAARNSVQPSLRSKRGQYVSSVRCPSSISPGRRSRFQEGSMRDRASLKPPPEFTGEHSESSACYLTEEESVDGRPKRSEKRAFYQRHAKSTSHLPTPTMTTETISAREPRILRFGKKFASAFGFSDVLHNVSEIWKGPQDGSKPSSRELSNDRKIQAEAAYAELKASGYPGTIKAGHFNMGNKSKTASPVKFANSGVSGRGLKYTSRENTTVHTNVNKDLPQPPAEFGLLTTSTLRPTRSFMSISPSKKQTADGPISKDLPKKHSMKDLLKRERLKERLTRKVSKLEEEWEKAQKELRSLSSEGEFNSASTPVSPVRGRNPFIPGKLPSLPSERLLQRQVNGDDDQMKTGSRVNATRMSEAPPSTLQRGIRRSIGRIKETEENNKKRKTSTFRFSEHGCTEETAEAEEIGDLPSAKRSKSPSVSPPMRHQPPRKAKSQKMGPMPGYIHVQDIYKSHLSTPSHRNHAYSSRLRRRPSQEEAFTATPGQNGVPPVPPLPEKIIGSSKKGEFQWPDEIF